MPGRLAKVSCPHCGAPIRVDVTSQFATCEYCKRISFVHRPKEPVHPAPPGYENYGHIQLPRSAVRSPWLVPVIVAFFAVDLLIVIGVAVTLILARSSSSSPAMAPMPTTTRPSAISPADVPAELAPCAQLVRCCMAIQPDQEVCNLMLAIPPADCARQLPQMQQAARAMGRRCD